MHHRFRRCRAAQRLAALLLAALLLAGALPAAAQVQPSFTVAVRAGYDGVYRPSEWFPVQVDIANDGPDVQGELEWHYPGQPSEDVFRTRVDLPRGARKRVTLATFSSDFARNGQLRLTRDGRELLRQNVNLTPLDGNRFVIGVISSDGGLLNSLNGLTLPNAGDIDVLHFELDALPTAEPMLRTLNALVLHDIDSSTLSDEQRRALVLWAALGGQLVVSGGPSADRTAVALADLLPVELTGSSQQGSLEALARLSQRRDGPRIETALSVVRTRPGTTALPSRDQQLLWTGHIGDGRIIVSAFDIAALRGWEGEPSLWQRLLHPSIRFAPATTSRQQRTNLLEQVLKLPALGIPSTLTLLAFLLVYILAVGPGTYWVLRRMRRLEWAWLTLPVTVVAFTSFFYLVGFGVRGGATVVSQAAVVQGIEGQDEGLATSYTGIFSPRRTSYTLAFPAGSLAHEVRTWSNSEMGRVPVLDTGSGTLLERVVVDVGSVRTVLAEAPVQMSLSVSSSFDGSNGDSGEVRNTSGRSFEEALVVRGEQYSMLGNLEAGETARFAFTNANGGFPWGVQLTDTEHFNRSGVLNQLFISDQGTSRFGPSDIYLLAWSNEVITPITVNGQSPSINGATLYVIRLNQHGFAQNVPPTAAPTPEPATVPTEEPTPTPLEAAYPEPEEPTPTPIETATPPEEPTPTPIETATPLP